MTQQEAPSIYTEAFFEAWEKFTDELGLIFKYPGEEGRPLATKQSQYVLANLALASLLHSVGAPDAGSHFHRLAEALQDVVDGVDHPLFQVEKIDRDAAGKRGRKPDTSETWRVRASLCIGIQFLMAGGLPQDEAISFVNRIHRMQLVNLQRPGTNLKSSITTWLKSFATDTVSNEAALDAYKLGMNDLASLRACETGDAIRDAGKRLVANAAASASKLPKSK